MKGKWFTCVWLFATLWTIAHQAPPSMGFSRQEYLWVGCHFLLQEIFPTQGLNPGLPHCRQTLYRLSHQGSILDKARSNSQWGESCPVSGSGLSSPVPYVDCSDPSLEAREQETNPQNPRKQQEQKKQARRLSLFLCRLCSNGLLKGQNFYLTRIIRKS